MRKVLALLLLSLCAVSIATAQVSFSSTRYDFIIPVNGAVSGDFNRDGKPDIAVVDGQAEVAVFLATTAGHYPATGTIYPVHDSPVQVRTADVNNDGKLDLVIAFGPPTPTISVLLGNGDGTFTSGPDLTTAHSVGTQGFDLGDFNHDGKIDMAVVECDSSNVCDMRAYLGTGTGAFTPGYKIQMTGLARSISAQDMNGDGNLDLILSRTNSVLIFGGDGTGRFPTFTKFTPPAHCTDPNVCTDTLDSVVAADFNNDARLDFAVLQAHGCNEACGDNTVYVYKNAGSYSFAVANHFPIGDTAGGLLLAADLNGDQNIDLLGYLQYFRAPYVTLERGSGNFAFTVESNNLPISDPAQMIARDLNLDSRHDVVEANGGPNDESMVVALNTNAFTNCAPPSSANLAAKICGPAANASVTSPVLVKASGNSPAGVQRLEVWIDGAKKYQKWNDQLAKKFTLTAGSHKITVVAVDLYKGTAKASVSVNVP
jgi:hypothetical protein